MGQQSAVSSQQSRLEEKILIAGFGGQGIMFLGRIIAEAAVAENKNTTYIRSYGAEIRGGTAYCLVRIEGDEISSPVFEYPTIAIIMNQPSLDKFKDRLTKAKLVLVNSSLLRKNSMMEKGLGYLYPFNELANSLGNLKAANTVALGALLRKYQLVQKATVTSVLRSYFKSAPDMLDLNLKALDTGWNINR